MSLRSCPSAQQSSAAQCKRALLSEHLACLKFLKITAQLNWYCELRTDGVCPLEMKHVRAANLGIEHGPL